MFSCCVYSAGKEGNLYLCAVIFVMDHWLFAGESEIRGNWVGKYYKEILSGLSFVSPVRWDGKHFRYISGIFLLNKSKGASRQHKMHSHGGKL